ncbi:microtubule associated protein [Purpureocillium lavendulum]|uniref:Microtubule associated protein n=1 Tax=Purpureocillium lavendulum TaxID=1247861 RepID=A0AB34FE25_9HYPO|nr:microtubule associated protein [Purpureocillium lavendulum]
MASRPPKNRFVATMRKIYNPIGFSKGYNFVLWFIFSGAMLGFCLARFMYLNYDGVYCPRGPGVEGAAVPGECWTYSSKTYLLVGIKMHLYCIIPASFLACFQFVPIIRHKVILAHRMNGYLVLLLSGPGAVGCVMVSRHAFGGGIDIQVIVGLMSIMFLGALGLALYNVKMLQLEQHRAWMLRAWFYAAAIITCRFIMGLASVITSLPSLGPYYYAKPCDLLATFYNSTSALEAKYPMCASPGAWAAVKADAASDAKEARSASLNMTFGMGLWLALALHAIGIEFYLQLTPAESERLRNVSYQRQLEAGHKNPGRSGLTADRIGDAALWVPGCKDKQAGEATVDRVPEGTVGG